MNRFKLSEESLRKFVSGEADFVRGETYSSLLPMPDIEGTILFNGVRFSLDKKFEVVKIELLYENESIAEMSVKDVTKDGKVTLILMEGIMRIRLTY